MIQEGAIEGASAAYAMHVWPTIPTGQLATRSGTIMAGVSEQLALGVLMFCTPTSKSHRTGEYHAAAYFHASGPDGHSGAKQGA